MGLLLVQWCVRSQMAWWPSHLLIKFNYFCPIPWLEIFCPWELRPVELRMLGQEEKSCKWVIRWNGSKRSHYHFHPLTPGPMNSGYIIVQFRTYRFKTEHYHFKISQSWWSNWVISKSFIFQIHQLFLDNGICGKTS